MLSRQRGLSLLESLIAMALLASAVLALLGGQLHGFSEQRASGQRADALRLVDDLTERIRGHSVAALDAMGHLIDWDDDGDEISAAAACAHESCDATALLRADLRDWKQAVAQTLPFGRARLFLADAQGDDGAASSAGLLTVVLAWHPGGAGIDRTGEAGGAAPIDCPPRRICQRGHVPF